jgi:hypothetical protein
MGTPDYMSPEQAEGDQVDGRSDVYGLGIVMYECLTGRVPFKADNPLTLIRKIIDQKPVSPREVSSQVPKWLNDIILKTLEKDPDNRILTGAFLAQSLREQKIITGDLKEYITSKTVQLNLDVDIPKKKQEKSKDDLTQYVSARTARTKKSGGKVALLLFFTVVIVAAAAAFYFNVISLDQIPFLNREQSDDAGTDIPPVTEIEEIKPALIPAVDSTKEDSSTQVQDSVADALTETSADSVKEKKPATEIVKTVTPPKAGLRENTQENLDKVSKDKAAAKISEPEKNKQEDPQKVRKEDTVTPAKVNVKETKEEDLEKARREQTKRRIRELEAELVKAKEAEADSKKKYDHAKKMREKDLLSPADLSFAQLDYESAKAKVEELEISIKVLNKQIGNN